MLLWVSTLTANHGHRPCAQLLWRVATARLTGLSGCQPTSKSSERPFLKGIRQRVIRQDTRHPPLKYLHTYADIPHTYTHAQHTHTYIYTHYIGHGNTHILHSTWIHIDTQHTGHGHTHHIGHVDTLYTAWAHTHRLWVHTYILYRAWTYTQTT